MLWYGSPGKLRQVASHFANEGAEAQGGNALPKGTQPGSGHPLLFGFPATSLSLSVKSAKWGDKVFPAHRTHSAWGSAVTAPRRSLLVIFLLFRMGRPVCLPRALLLWRQNLPLVEGHPWLWSPGSPSASFSLGLALPSTVILGLTFPVAP